MEKILGQNVKAHLTTSQAAEILYSASRYLKSDREEVQDEIRALHWLNKETEICVAIFAPYNSGKSTLINALIGKELLPAKVIRTTACPISIKYGGRLEIIVIYKNGARKIFNDISILKSFAVLGSPHATSDISLIEITSPLLKHLRGFKFLDLPGTEDVESLNQTVNTNLLRADIIVQIVNARQAFSQHEILKTKEWLFERGINSVIFVVNFMNLLADNRERKTVLAEMKKYFRVFRSDLPFLFSNFHIVDVLPALRLKLSSNFSPTAHFQTGLPEFLLSLQTLLRLHGQMLIKKRYNRQVVTAKKIKADLEHQAAILKSEIGRFIEWRNGEIRKGQLLEKQMKKELDDFFHAISNQLSYYSLLSNYSFIIAARLKENAFQQWQQQFLNSVGYAQINALNIFVKKISAHYGFDYQEFKLPTVAAPVVYFPAEPSLNKWEKFINWTGLDDIKGRKMNQHIERRNELASAGADDYIKRFSSKSLREFNTFTAQVKLRISYQLPVIPQQMFEKEQYRNTLDKFIHNLKEISKTESVSIRQKNSTKAFIFFIYIKTLFYLKCFVERVRSLFKLS